MPIPDWKQIIVRAHNQSGKVVGAGFLVSHDLLVTSAHVVEDAIGSEISGSLLDEALIVTIDFAFATQPITCTARVVVWKAYDSEINDLALLQITDGLPPKLQIPPLHLSDSVVARTECQTYG